MATASPVASPKRTPSGNLGIFEPVAGRIVYPEVSSLGISLWALDPTAPAVTAATKVVLASESAIPVGWSSDGTRLLMERAGDGAEGLFVLDADGSVTQVTDQPIGPGRAAISRDGSRVAFIASEALYIADAEGGPAEMLLESRFGILTSLTFAPDGTRIAYVDGHGDWGETVWLVNVDGSDAHQILANEPHDAAGHLRGLAWSPTGDRIALEGPAPEPGSFRIPQAIYTFATDGSDFRQLTTGGFRPYWSPDGTQIAYTGACSARGRCVLEIADADGSNVVTFNFGEAGPWHPGTLK
jgi:Tol biopolymer transport system component